MPGGIFGLEIARSGIFANQQALDVTGQNIANVNNEDYHKQRVVMEATSPLFPLGFPGATVSRQIGTGVDVKMIERMRDLFLERRIREENEDLGQWAKAFDYLHQVELIYNEPSDNSLRARADEFWKTLQDLSNHPEDMAVRAAVRENALGLTEIISQQAEEFGRLGGKTLNTAVNRDIKIIVDDLNGAAQEIAQLNRQIQVQIAAGHKPNDLLDQRDGIIKRLSKQINLQVTESDGDDFLATVSGLTLAQGIYATQYETRLKSDATLGIYVKGTTTELMPNGGELKALFDFRDTQLPAHIRGLSDFAVTLVDKFNDIHRNGFGLDGSTNVNFFDPFLTQSEGIHKITGKTFVKNPELALNGGLYGTVRVQDIRGLLNGSANFNGALDGNSTTTGLQTSGTLTFNDINDDDLDSDGAQVLTGGTVDLDSGDTSTAAYVAYDLTTDTLEDIVNNINRNVSIASGVNPAAPTLRRTGAEAKIVDGKLVINGVYSMKDSGNLLNKLGMTPEKENFENTTANAQNYPTGQLRVGKGQISIDQYKVFYDGNADSLQDIVRRINDLRIGVTAEINAQNRFTLRATAGNDFKIQELSDTGNLLERLGVLSASSTFESGFLVLDSGTDGSAGGTHYLDSQRNNINRGPAGQGFLFVNGVDIFSQRRVGPATAPTPTAGAAGLVDVGTHTYVVTYVDSNGVESLPGPPSAVVTLSTASQVSLSGIPTGPTGTASRKIYRTLEGNSPAFRLVGTIADNTTTSFTDNVPNAGLGAQATAPTLYDARSSTGTPPTLPGLLYNSVQNLVSNITLENVRDAINASAAANATLMSGVSASLTEDNRLIVNGVSSWRDTGDLTQVLRIAPRSQVYTSGDAASEVYITGVYGRPPVDNFAFSIDVSDSVKNDLRKIAAAGGLDQDLDGVGNQSLGPGNGDTMLKLADIKDARIMDNNSSTMDQFFGGLVSTVGIDTRLADTNQQTQLDVLNSVELLNKSISGVSLDEEMVNLMKYQRGFQASARFLNVTDQMIDVLLGMGAS
ncbi:MAG: flagellar hook-associated protein FlgK [Candidatus Lindowbacteria bacterium RIFCSPLOWO2_12_FULL_62_27]|nr:MAG: flagellar hook-associated protein FlgK [Candidatus Lindowbacteria bacterium RIFCSPLOWO2_12_FULL_62_27]OGH61515.1 MAG: flagellar hook-associated protein FlgK [Candidatus Lindowbacteria bacterium RIFCSPLOWO2_02_FULL_62_12]